MCHLKIASSEFRLKNILGICEMRIELSGHKEANNTVSEFLL